MRFEFGLACKILHRCVKVCWSYVSKPNFEKHITTRMWANDQRDGRPAEYRWRPLFNAAKFGWCPLLKCCAVTPPRHKTRWNSLDWSQPLVGRSSPYCENIWGILLFNNFFPIVDMCLSWEYIAIQSCARVPRWQSFGDFLRPVFSANRVQHISDLRLKFALMPHGPHHEWKYSRHPICNS